MAAFSLTDAAFEGFRLTRERPKVVGVWAAFYGLMILIVAVVMVSTIGPQFATLRAAASRAAPGDPAEVTRQFRVLGPFFVTVFPLVLVFWSVLTCAVYRVILRPEEGGVGRFRFGGDELRMAALTLALWALGVANVFLFTLFYSLGGVIAAGGGLLPSLIGNMIGAAALALTVWVWVRLSLAGPVTFATGEIHIFRSWALTRGHFWRLLMAYALATILAAVVSLMALVIFEAVAGVIVTVSGRRVSDIGRVFNSDTTSLAAYFTPAQILYEVFWSILQVVVYAVVLSPAAVIYAALTGRPINAA